jgi:hypothetical protein
MGSQKLADRTTKHPLAKSNKPNTRITTQPYPFRIHQALCNLDIERASIHIIPLYG